MKPMPSVNWSDTIFIGQINDHEKRALNKLIASLDGVTIEGPYNLASEAMVFCEPAKRGSVVAEIEKINAELMSFA